MEIRILKYFLTVVSEGSITRAADVLHITQPTLSRQLAQMEDELGVSLFERGSRKIRLTNEGVLLKRRAREIVELAEKAEAELRVDERSLSGTIAMGLGEFASCCEVARVFEAFRARHPLVHFNLRTGDADEIKERMDKGLTDVGLLMEPTDLEKYSFVRLPVREQWAICLPPDSPLATQKSVTPEDLAPYPIIMPSRPGAESEVASWFGPLYQKLNVPMRSNLSTNSCIMTAAGLGYAMTLVGSLPFIDPGRLVVKPLDPPLGTSTVLVWKKHLPLSSIVRHFTEFAHSFLSQSTKPDGERK